MTEFQLVNDKGSFHGSMWCVEIMNGPYTGLVYQYDTIRLVDSKGNIVEDDTPEEEMYVTFNTITIKNPNEVELTNEQSKQIFGEILNKLMTEEIDRMTLIDEDYVEEIDESESLNTEESDT